MQRSSNKVGTLAAALAKAQAEIANPEKSLTATIEIPVSARGPADLSLRLPVRRPRHRSQMPRPA